MLEMKQGRRLGALANRMGCGARKERLAVMGRASRASVGPALLRTTLQASLVADKHQTYIARSISLCTHICSVSACGLLFTDWYSS